MKFHLVSLLLTSVSVSAHLGYSHHETSKKETSNALGRGLQASLLPVKTNRSTIDWTQDDRLFRLGDHVVTTVKEFKESGGRCACRDPPKNERTASQEKVESFARAHPEEFPSDSTRRLQAMNIPVYIHCMASGATGECSETVVNQQIAILNAAYSPDFSFALVSSKSYDRPEYYNCDADDIFGPQDQRMKKEFHQGGKNTLNIYSCNSYNGTAGFGTLGWANFPEDIRSPSDM
jgi:hypothetical protein